MDIKILKEKLKTTEDRIKALEFELEYRERRFKILKALIAKQESHN